MAGFAVVMDFLGGGALLLIIATVAALCLNVYGKASAPGDHYEARRYRRELVVAPFAGILWLVLCLVIYTWISNHIAHQSVSFSPDPFVTLSNGYVVGSLNTYDGYVHAPGMDIDVPWTGPGYVRSLIDLDYVDGRFQGTYLDSHSDMQPQVRTAFDGSVWILVTILSRPGIRLSRLTLANSKQGFTKTAILTGSSMQRIGDIGRNRYLG